MAGSLDLRLSAPMSSLKANLDERLVQAGDQLNGRPAVQAGDHPEGRIGRPAVQAGDHHEDANPGLSY
jgi:hypothetical protein